jgi:hypothetical protein
LSTPTPTCPLPSRRASIQRVRACACVCLATARAPTRNPRVSQSGLAPRPLHLDCTNTCQSSPCPLGRCHARLPRHARLSAAHSPRPSVSKAVCNGSTKAPEVG